MNQPDTPVSDPELVELAQEARTHAYAPFSEYQVGAALVAGDSVYTGANIEIEAWIPSVHAEMLAVYQAVYAGDLEFDRIAVSPADQSGEAPCGICQHVLAQFTDDLQILEDTGHPDEIAEYQLTDLIGDAYRPQTRE